MWPLAWLVSCLVPFCDLLVVGGLSEDCFPEGEDLFPVVLHVHNRPAALRRFLECLDEFTGALRLGIVGVFAFAVCMPHDEAEAQTRVIYRGVLQHRLVAVAVANAGDGPPADELMNADWLTRFVVHEQMIESLHQNRSAVAQLECRSGGGPDNLLGRDAVNPLHPDT